MVMDQKKIMAEEIEGSDIFLIYPMEGEFFHSINWRHLLKFISLKNSDTRQLPAVYSSGYIKKINIRAMKPWKLSPKMDLWGDWDQKIEGNVLNQSILMADTGKMSHSCDSFSHQNFILGTIHHCPERPRYTARPGSWQRWWRLSVLGSPGCLKWEAQILHPSGTALPITHSLTNVPRTLLRNNADAGSWKCRDK